MKKIKKLAFDHTSQNQASTEHQNDILIAMVKERQSPLLLKNEDDGKPNLRNPKNHILPFFSFTLQQLQKLIIEKEEHEQ